MFLLILLAIKNGVITKIGILADINKIWKDANAEIDVVPTATLNIAAMIVPAQVGQPMKRPQVAPIPPIIPSLFSFIFLRAKTYKEILNPTNMETIKTKRRFNGIRNIKKYGVI